MATPAAPLDPDSLQPAHLWQIFAGIASVPRPSKKEQRIREHVRALAADRGLEVRQDSIGNLAVDVPASAGCQSAPLTVLQGHLDMVCEKNTGTVHHFDTDPIRLLADTDPSTGQAIVRADGTTLGADNGIGVSLALAAAFDPGVTHGPLELLFTVDEEAGMSGAKALAPDFVKGRRLINLDSEEDDAIYIGCAGGCDSTLTWQFDATAAAGPSQKVSIAVTGLAGGHSGADIHLNRTNAIKLLVQCLQSAGLGHLQLIEINGGSLRNAIAREARATLAVPPGGFETLQASAQRAQSFARDAGEQRCAIQAHPDPDTRPGLALLPSDSQAVLDALAAIPSGVLSVEPQIAGLVRTSNNLATIESSTSTQTNRCTITCGCLSRSSLAGDMQQVLDQISAIARLSGAQIEHGNDYPGWQPNLDSPLLASARRLYQRLFQQPPQVTAIHAGLECGIIGERTGRGMDMISIGPNIQGAHSPDERVYVASVEKTWTYLVALLEDLAKS
ncbi:MAG: beta-Ala-His dipeptidase [Phycisphaerae bacterium]